MIKQEKYGFVYIWYDRKHKRYYVGCHWGTIDDGYICSSSWMMQAFPKRPNDFKRKILKTNLTREQMYIEEQNYLNMIKPEEIKIRYYNLNLKNFKPWHMYPESVKTIGEKISYSKKGKSINFKNPSERNRKISEGKLKAFQKRLEETGSKMINTENMGRKPGYNHTEQWKQQNSEKLKEQWATGIRSKELQSKIMKGNKYSIPSKKKKII